MVAPFHADTPLHEIEPRNWHEEARLIIGEVAARLLELEEIRHDASSDFLFRLVQLYELSPLGYRIALDALAGGDLSRSTAPLAQLAEIEGRHTKQSVNYAFNTGMKAIRAAFPELATALEDLRVCATRCKTLGDQSDAEVLHGTRPSVSLS